MHGVRISSLFLCNVLDRIATYYRITKVDLRVTLLLFLQIDWQHSSLELWTTLCVLGYAEIECNRPTEGTKFLLNVLTYGIGITCVQDIPSLVYLR